MSAEAIFGIGFLIFGAIVLLNDVMVEPDHHKFIILATIGILVLYWNS